MLLLLRIVLLHVLLGVHLLLLLLHHCGHLLIVRLLLLLVLFHVDFLARHFLYYTELVLLHHLEVGVLALLDVVVDAFDLELVRMHLTLVVL